MNPSTKDPVFLSNNQLPPSILPVLEQDKKACKTLLQTLSEGASEFNKRIYPLKQQLSNIDSFSEGIGFYDSKNLLVAQYLIQLQFYMLFKLNGADLTKGIGFELYKRLIYLKTLLMKLDPLEKKLEYRVNKVLKSAAEKIVTKVSQSEAQTRQQKKEVDALNYKPNPDNLERFRTTHNIHSDDSEKQIDERESPKVKKSSKKLVAEVNKNRKDSNINVEDSKQKYVAPKISAQLMTKDKEVRRLERTKQRENVFLQRKLKSVLLDGVDEDNIEDINMKSTFEQKLYKKYQDKIRYEQANFTRLPVTKQEKRLMKKAERAVNRDDIADMREERDISKLLQNHYKKIQQVFSKCPWIDFKKQDKFNKTMGIPEKKLKRT